MSSDAPRTVTDTLGDGTTALPDDPRILQQMVRELLDVLLNTQRENEELRHRLDLLLQRLHGPRPQRFDPNQPLLLPELLKPEDPHPADDPAVADQAAEPVHEQNPASKTKQRGHGRKAIPKNLPVYTVEHKLTEAECTCPECGKPLLPCAEEVGVAAELGAAPLPVAPPA